MNRCSTPATSSGSPPRSLKASAATRPSAGVISSNGLAPAAPTPASRASPWGSSGMLTRSSHAADEQVFDPDATAGTVSIVTATPTTFAPLRQWQSGRADLGPSTQDRWRTTGAVLVGLRVLVRVAPGQCR